MFLPMHFSNAIELLKNVEGGHVTLVNYKKNENLLIQLCFE